MANRTVSRIYTRTGDAGETALFDGTRVSKADPRVEAYGEVDELVSWLGLVLSENLPADLDGMLREIQRSLFALGSALADPGHRIAARVTKARLTAADVERLEGWINALDAELTPLRRFILAGGNRAGAMCHVARAVCRRAERRIAALGNDVDPLHLTYINRLSDLLFTVARAANARTGTAEIEW